jgi:hypothetical protein
MASAPVTPKARTRKAKASAKKFTRNGREQKQTSDEKNKVVFAFTHRHFLLTRKP